MNALSRPHRTPAAALFLTWLCACILALGGCQKTPATTTAPATAESKPQAATESKPQAAADSQSRAGGDSQPQAAGDSQPQAAADSKLRTGGDSAARVSLKPAEIQSMGIVIAAAVPANHVPEAAGFGVVSPHEAIAQAVAEWVTAAAAERQSRAVLARTQRLAGTPGAMAADAQESAQRQATVDQAALLLARRRLTASFGQNPPWKNDAASPVLRALAGGEAKLVRVTFPLGALSDETPATLRLAHIDPAKPGRSWVSTTVWNAPADTTLPGRSVFALLQGSNAGEGERLLAWAPTGSPESGVLVPASAAVISDGKLWCYVERKPGVFVRIELDTSIPLADGYFVKVGIAAGDSVVTASAGLLLARETNPGTAAD